jgi:hypothetical protein
LRLNVTFHSIACCEQLSHHWQTVLLPYGFKPRSEEQDVHDLFSLETGELVPDSGKKYRTFRHAQSSEGFYWYEYDNGGQFNYFRIINTEPLEAEFSVHISTHTSLPLPVSAIVANYVGLRLFRPVPSSASPQSLLIDQLKMIKT